MESKAIPGAWSWIVILVMFGCALSPPREVRQAPVAPDGFAILENHCGPCHHQRGYPKIDFGSKQSLVDRGYVVAGSSRSSPVYQRIAANQMPPNRPLSRAQKEAIRRSIDGMARSRASRAR